MRKHLTSIVQSVLRTARKGLSLLGRRMTTSSYSSTTTYVYNGKVIYNGPSDQAPPHVKKAMEGSLAQMNKMFKELDELLKKH
jgi:hypothetical protein